MTHVELSVMAKDRPGIMNDVIGAVREKRFEIGPVWADTRHGTFFLTVGLVFDPDDPTLARLEEMKRSIEALDLLVLLIEHDGEAEQPGDRADFSADIAIEGPRRVEILHKTVTAIAAEQACVSSVRTEELGDELRYVLRARYASGRRESVKHAIVLLSQQNQVELQTA